MHLLALKTLSVCNKIQNKLYEVYGIANLVFNKLEDTYLFLLFNS